MKIKIGLLLLIALLNASCGFYLRGSQPTDIAITSVYVQHQQAPQTTRYLSNLLAISGVLIPEQQEEAEYVVDISQENFSRRVSMVDPQTGKVQEYELTLTATFDILNKAGAYLVQNETLKITRDFYFDSSAILGEFNEEKTIKEEMLKSWAAQILRRLTHLPREPVN